MKKGYLIFLILIVFYSGCAWLPGGEKVRDDRVLLVAIDRSRSMQHNDPNRLSVMGSQLFFALSSGQAQVGAVAFSDIVEKIIPVSALSSRTQREAACKRISEIPLKGTGNLGNALKEFHKLLGKADAGRGSNLVIFSDGKDGLDTVSPELAEFKKRGWRIHTVAVTPKTSAPLLASISQSTSGKHFKIERPQELIQTHLRIGGEEDLFTFIGDRSAITVLPGTERLLLTAMRSSNAGGFADAFTVKEASGKTRTVTKKDSNIFVFPLTGAEDPGFEALNIWNPLTGVWSVSVKERTEEVNVGCSLPLKRGFEAKTLKSSYFEGEPVDFQFTLATEDKDFFAVVKNSGECSVSITTDGAPVCLSLPLTVKFEEPDEKTELWKVTYAGRTHPFLSEVGVPQNFLLTLSLAINCPEGGKWLYRKEEPFELKPGAPPLICQPAIQRVNFGSHWIDLITEHLKQEVSLSTKFEGGLNISLSSELSPSLSVSPTEFRLSGTGEPVKVNIALDSASAPPGAHEESLSFAVKTSETGYPVRELILPVTFGIYRFTGRDIETRGYPAEAVRVPLNFSAEPEVTLSVRTEKLIGPRELPVTISGEGAQQTIEVAIPADASDGDYVGELEIIPSVEGLAHRKQKFTLRVEATPRVTFEPERIQLKTDRSGWIETSLTVTLKHFETIQITVERTSLTGTEVSAEISKELDTELVPEEGWDGRTLAPAQKKTFALRLFVSPDLPGAKYEGKITISATYSGERTITAQLPIILEVSR